MSIETGGYNPNNPNNMAEKSYEEKMQSERERFDSGIASIAQEIADGLRLGDNKEFIERIKDDLIRDYADVENLMRDKRSQTKPRASSEIFEAGEGSDVVEELIVEKVKKGYDTLTGVVRNRSFFDQEEERRRKNIDQQGKFSIIMIDIDKFKDVNDKLGHKAGDQILQQVGLTLYNNMRTGSSDVLARYGGEEFIIIAPNANGDVKGFAERLRKAVEDTTFTVDGKNITEYKDPNEEPLIKKVTISAGVSPFKKSFNEMKNTADAGLYFAKGKQLPGTEVGPEDKIPTESEARNQVWSLDETTGKYSLYKPELESKQ